MPNVLSQLFAAIAVALITVSVGKLTDNVWWSMLLLGMFLLASSFALYTSARNDGDSTKGR